MKKFFYLCGYAICFMISMFLGIMFFVNKLDIHYISVENSQRSNEILIFFECFVEGVVFALVHLRLMQRYFSQITVKFLAIFWAFVLNLIIGLGLALYIIIFSYIGLAMSHITITWPFHFPSIVIHSPVHFLGIARLLAVFGVTGLVSGVLWIRLKLANETEDRILSFLPANFRADK